MASVNKHIIIGSLGADPEKKTFQDGNSIVNIRVATSESWTDRQSGERRQNTQWHSVTIKNDALAKVAAQYLKKGSRVYLEGRVETRKFTDQSGNERYATETIIPAFGGALVLLGDPRGEGGQGGEQNQQQSAHGGTANASAPKQGAPERDWSRGLDDEIPFAPEFR